MTQALMTLLELAERQRDEALATLLQSEGAARRLRQQFEQLSAYRDEYRLRNPAQGGRTASIELLRCHQNFLQRLDQALAQLADQLQGVENHIATARTDLLAQETRVASVRKLRERRGADARQQAARQEQRRSDDARPQRRHDDGPTAQLWRGGSELMPLTH